jgi:hypothetical protein
LYYHSIWYRHSLYSTVKYAGCEQTVLQSARIRRFRDAIRLLLLCRLLSSGILYRRLQSDDTRCCDNTICPPEDGHVNARNMSRIVM